MTKGCARIELMGEILIADPTGAAFWPGENTLLVADLHFEKGSAFAAKGQMLPPYDTRATLLALTAAIERHNPARVIALGDSFHDGEAGIRISEQDLNAIQTLTKEREWTWITGNHDEILPGNIGGVIEAEQRIGPLTLRHEPNSGESLGEIAGHLHPCAIVRTRSRRLRRRCFVSDGARMILPAFGAFTGGLEITDDAYEGLFRSPPKIWVLGRDRIYAITAGK